MAFQSQRSVFRVAAGLVGLGVVMLALPAPASAGFFERLFGAVQRAVEPPPRAPLAFVDPFTSLAKHINGQPQQQPHIRADAVGPSRAFCVRTCDGRYFPVQARAGMSAAESCRAFCPASNTKLYGGSNIDYAMTNDGSRYADMPNAFLYRKQLVAGCTCNGRDAFGLAPIEAASDPTLRQGDIVATRTGFVAYAGTRNNVADFTPVENYSRLSKSVREKLAETKIMLPAPTPAAAPDITSAITPVSQSSRGASNDRIQFVR